jgi:hypothetical protein
MALNCPNCGAEIPAENINIQETLALCDQCNHVFNFKGLVAARKGKPHVGTPPKRLQIQEDDDRLDLSYRLVFGPGPKFGGVMASIGAVMLSVLLPTMISRGEPAGAILFLGMFMVVAWYLVAVFLTTTTRVHLDEDTLHVQSGPLPFPIKDDKTLNASDIARIFYKESVEVMPSGMPAHNVQAELTDGSQRSVVTSLPRDHAYYIARILDDRLQSTGSAEIITPGDEFHEEMETGEGDAAQLADLMADDQTASARS